MASTFVITGSEKGRKKPPNVCGFNPHPTNDTQNYALSWLASQSYLRDHHSSFSLWLNFDHEAFLTHILEVVTERSGSAEERTTVRRCSSFLVHCGEACSSTVLPLQTFVLESLEKQEGIYKS